MKMFVNLAVLLLSGMSSLAWMDLQPDYKKQFESSDVVAVVRVTSISDTGVTNALQGTRLRFREMRVEMRVTSLLKGEAPEQIKCMLYRFPTESESKADWGEREGPFVLLEGSPWETGLFVPKQWDYYLGYLKRRGDGTYYPARGFEEAILCLVELRVPFTTSPDGPAEPGGAANRSQPVRPKTDRTSAAAGPGG
jgi:hypothetical protein